MGDGRRKDGIGNRLEPLGRERLIGAFGGHVFNLEGPLSLGIHRYRTGHTGGGGKCICSLVMMAAASCGAGGLRLRHGHLSTQQVRKKRKEKKQGGEERK